jgi:DNA polymerase/3'-5' exonuclease PolX
VGRLPTVYWSLDEGFRNVSSLWLVVTGSFGWNNSWVYHCILGVSMTYGNERRNISYEEGIRLGADYLVSIQSGILRGAIIGSLLRNHDYVHDIDILVIQHEGIELPKPAKPINLFRCTKETWESHLMHYAVGLAVMAIRSNAKKRGYKLNQYGLFEGDVLKAQKAQDICFMLDIPIPDSVLKSLSGELVIVSEPSWQRL